MDTPFKLYIQENQKHIDVPCYATMEQCMETAPIPLLENRALSFTFIGEGVVRFDCIEDAFKSGVHTLYHYENKHVYPFSPGIQLGCVNVGSSTYYFQLFIQPRVPIVEHERMMTEIERFLAGYSTQQTSAFTQTLPTHFFQLLDRIQQQPIHQITQSYTLEEVGKGTQLNQRGHQYAMHHPAEQRQFVRKKQIDWNQPANQFLKILLQNHIPYLLPHEVARVRQFLQQDWMQDVQLPSHYIDVCAYVHNPHYLEIHRILQNHSSHTTIKQTVQRSKSGADIYEVWGYLKVIETFKELGYTLQKSTLTLKHNSKGNVVFDQSVQNYVELIKGEQLLRIFWEDAILRNLRNVSPTQPLYTWHNHTPDCRIDFWQNQEYKGTQIIDFKYRHLEKQWTKTIAYGEQVGSVFKQLSAYALIRSNSQLLNGMANTLLDVAPVQQVWAVTPYLVTQQETIEGYPIHLYTLKPGSPNDTFKNNLASIAQTI